MTKPEFGTVVYVNRVLKPGALLQQVRDYARVVNTGAYGFWVRIEGKRADVWLRDVDEGRTWTR